MRRTIVAVTGAIAALLMMAGVALALDIACVSGGNCVGTDNADTMQGTRGFDRMYGRAGNDEMYGDYAEDLMFGESQADTMYGEYGPDTVRGGEGNDTIYGGPAADSLFGNAGIDTVDGDVGADFVNVVDGQHDSVSCGLGNDRAIIDEVDQGEASFEDFVRLSSCEDLRIR